jgi:hypothetical protein
MQAATPGLRVPTSVRVGDALPRIVRADDLLATVVAETGALLDDVAGGSVAVVAPDDCCEAISASLDAAGLAHGRAAAGLGQSLTVVPVSVVKGLELDAVVVVEPARIADDPQLGLRALYVALTRSTRRLTVVHSEDLPASMAAAPDQVPVGE